jgi:hypothetical protein
MPPRIAHDAAAVSPTRTRRLSSLGCIRLWSKRWRSLRYRSGKVVIYHDPASP